MNCSLIITTKNEEKSIRKLLDSICGQTKKSTEIIIADAGSIDATRSIIRSYQRKLPLRLVELDAGTNRAIGRNRAIEAAKYEAILITDAGCELDRHWVEEMLKAFAVPGTQVVAGYYKGYGRNVFERCQIPYVLVMPDRYNPATFLPATRSMGMQKKVWKEMGGFTPAFRYAEDYIFARTLKDKKYKITPAPRAIVTWSARSSLASFSRMIREHAQGDAFSGAWRTKVALVFARYILFLLLLLFGLFQFTFFYLFVCLFILYLLLSIRKNYHYIREREAFVYLPILQFVSDVDVIFGTLSGLVSRLAKL